ncbi:YqjF family protein [Streptomyces sp. NPDC085596]|uniref:YqjF family protein n=1 Tax=Streptomyces sp. NPDC085596 TaxID=3365731 RepID=UPI0037CD4124
MVANRVPVLRARWLTQTFVSWPYEPRTVQALLPEGLVVDEYEGAAWVTLTPYLMADVRVLGLPALPTFAETNLRTYVRGRDGVWFFSLDVTCPLLLAGRVPGVPYHLADLRVSVGEDTVTYTGARRTGHAAYRLTVRPGAPVEPTRLDVWLTSRWRAYSRRLGVLWETPVGHEPWSLSGALVEVLEETVTGAAGLPAPRGEPVARFSERISHAWVGATRPLRSPTPPNTRQGGRS